jgi:hypothetical protein
MLAMSENSIVLLINPEAVRLANLPPQFRSHVESRRALLRDVAQISGVAIRLMGRVGDIAETFTSLPNCQTVLGDAVNFWRDKDAIESLGPPERHVLYCGGAWLDQDIIVAALSAVEIGYDTRVLVDISVAQTHFDRAGALERLMQHGVLMTSVRQTMVEWSLTAPKDGIGQQLREMPQE